MKKHILIIFLIVFITFSYKTPLFAQENPDEIALVDNELDNNFYNAVQQRAIENYDRAINAIQKCIDKQPDNPSFYYELGKNHFDLKQYLEAEQAFQKAVELNPKERWYWNGLYDVYYATKNYPKSIETVKKLIEFDPNMREDLVSLYMYTSQKDEALKLLNEMDKTAVLSAVMKQYRTNLTNENQQATSTGKDEKSLLKAIETNPKVEQNYVDLMMLYAVQNQDDKTIEVAKKLSREIPSSKWASISLFKIYLTDNKGNEASDELLKILQNVKVNTSLKHKLLNEFLIFSANSTQYDKQLEKAVDVLAGESNMNVAKEVAKFYYNKNNYQKTSLFLEKALTNNPNDWESIDLLLNNLLNEQNYEELANRSTVFIDSFPAQPRLYFYAGLAQNKLGKSKLAIDNLETGLEFVIDDKELEGYFHKQLADAYTATGNSKKAESHQAKAKELLKK